MDMLSYHQVHPSAFVFYLQWFEACPPELSCTGTLASVSPPDEAVTHIQSKLSQEKW